jgi:Bacterial protein of unknown function (DUF885)
MVRGWTMVCAGMILAGQLSSAWLHAGDPNAGTVRTAEFGQAAPDNSVPGDLRPLLAAPQSELGLVTQRYGADRLTLNGNYDGGRGPGRGGRGGGRGMEVPADGRAGRGADPAPAASVPPSLSLNRIARLKRFDLSWQAALGKLDAGKLSAAGRAELETLKATIQANLAALETDTAKVAELMPLVPFAPAIVKLNETRIRMEDVNSQQAAGVLTELTKDVAGVRARVEAGLNGAGSADALKVSKDLATRGADSVDGLRNSVTTWFSFYNGYDPLFTWWMGMPYKQVDDALQGYAAFLRDKVAPADTIATPISTTPAAIPPAAPTKLNDVPDLNELIALPQDEMRDVVVRFIGPSGGRGGRGATNSPGGGRPRQYYLDWLEALKTLDFDGLSRNAQVDYLFIKKTCERQIARIDFVPEANPPRKTDNTGIPGAARGRTGLVFDLADEMIPYTPEQLIALANKEFAWHEEEMKKASRQMGFGDDWKKAVEKVKGMYVPPGGQPAVVRDMLFEAVDYLRAKDLITVPEIASESFHMSMMSPEAQLSSPFFLGGSQIIVSYPTNTMEYEARLQSMRGNNIPFSHAVAFHEMIPGHNLVGYMGSRFANYRARIGGNTPFFGEGWPLYWELTLYDMGFHDTPEERVGALFWRMHRCARIIFSLNFHMGIWSPQESIDFLVDKVGHERDNATAEVRRSFQGGYGPLYQSAYLLGGLQLRGLRRELVDSRQMTNKQFHDEILRQGNMPIALIRLGLTKQKLTRDMSIDWKFYGDLPAQ